jgi:hypothetical protein
MRGKNLVHMPSMRKRPRSREIPTTRRASAAFMANGFSQRTAFPARRQSATFSAWKGWGVATYTISTSGSAASPP